MAHLNLKYQLSMFRCRKKNIMLNQPCEFGQVQLAG